MALFGTKKTTAKKPTTRVDKYTKAEQLRKETVKSIANEKRIVSQWNKQPSSAAVDSKYEKKLKAADKKSNESYAKYHKHVHSNFSKNQIDAAGGNKGKFISPSFTRDLKAKQAKPKRK